LSKLLLLLLLLLLLPLLLLYLDAGGALRMASALV
jgi:hypothetical protein